MGHLFFVLFQFFRRNLLGFTFIVLGLVAAPWVQREWGNIQHIVDELPALQRALNDVAARQATLADEVAQHTRQLSGASIQKLDTEIRTLEDEISALQREDGKGSILVEAVKGTDSMAARLKVAAVREVQIELRRQAKEYLIALRAHAMVMLDRQAANGKLEQLRLAHVHAYAAFLEAQEERKQYQANTRWFEKIPVIAKYTHLAELQKTEQNLLAANNRAHQAFLAQQTLLVRLPNPGSAAIFRIDEQRLAIATAGLRERLSQAKTLATQNYFWQVYQAVLPVLPAAFGALLAWWLVPAAIRTLFYFVLAPLAARRPSILIGRTDRTVPASLGLPQQSILNSSLISAVSQQVTLAPGYEILIRPDYCQSQPTGIVVTTKLLFNWHRWLTSIAAHLWMLKRLRTTQQAQIVVSSTVDALDEVALLELAQGDAIVLQPRGLIGVMYKAGQLPTIRSHWRIGTLHAWLTLQLRYLAFEGPATLIVKGCRGVRLESATGGRTVSQEATLGFSANACYATVRAEPFLPYLQGNQPLFHDKFEGPNAYYLCEEVPRNAHSHRNKHNPLEMLVDATLKAFGI